MNKKLLTLIIATIMALIVLNIRRTSSYSIGADPGNTGSPGDGASCVNCHAGSLSFQPGWITTNIPADGYMAGNTYSITTTAAKSGITKFGFQLSPQNTSGTLLGTLIANATTQLNGSGKYINHTYASTSGAGSASWTFNWTAPSSGTGDVTFYAAFVAANSSGDEDGDFAYTSSLTIQENAITPLTSDISAMSHVVCYGNCSGSATVSASGGITPYTYNWSTTPAQNTATATGLCAGNYFVTVADDNSNISIDTVTITQPASAVSVNITAQTNVLCYGGNTGSITADGVNGTSPYTYIWSTSPQQITASATGLPSGTYSVTVTDANLCEQSTTVSITQPASPISISINTTSANCGAADGSAIASAVGGTGNFSYLWNTVPTQTLSTASGLVAGNYTVTATDNNGCSSTATAMVSNAGGPEAYISSQTNIIGCYGDSTGNATVSAWGGTGILTYQWNTSPVQTDSVATGLPAGIFSVTVSDSANCIKIATVTLSQPDSLSGGTTVTDVSCYGDNNGTVTVAATGGTTPYSFLWNNGATTSQINNLSAQTYSVTITDFYNCQANISVVVEEPGELILSMSSIPDNGTGIGTAIVVVTGGSSPYSYYWSTGETNASVTNLSSGYYSVTVTDASGCSSSNLISVPLSARFSNYLSENAFIFPNPAKDQFNILLNVPKQETYSFELYNAMGQLLYKESILLSPGKVQKRIDTNVLQEGIFYITISSPDNKIVLRGLMLPD